MPQSMSFYLNELSASKYKLDYAYIYYMYNFN